MPQQQLETLFEFPCQFPIKVMGLETENLSDIVLAALKAVGVSEADVQLESRKSSEGKYVSVTALFEATSKPQLDTLYESLTQNPAVKIVL